MKSKYIQILPNKNELKGHFLMDKDEIKKVYIKKFIEPEQSNMEKLKVSEIKNMNFKFSTENYQKEYDIITLSEIISAYFFEYSFTGDNIERELIEAFKNVYENVNPKSYLIVHMRDYNIDFRDIIGPQIRSLIKMDRDSSPITTTEEESKSKTQKVELLILVLN